MTTDLTLAPPQLRALFDVLTHYETYAEVESFKDPEGIDNYGYPFTKTGDSATEDVESSSPLLQLLLTRLQLPMPGVTELPRDFWNIKFQGVMRRFAEAELSDSYDKGSLGTRKTLATAASAFHEAITRGILGGVPRCEVPGLEFKPDRDTADGLLDAYNHVIHETVYGDLVDELFDHFTKTKDFESHSPVLQTAVDYVIIHIATFLHRIYVLSPEGQYLLKLVETTHKLVPYSMVCQTLRVGNAATMMSGMLKLFLAKVSFGGLTNWIGLTKNAPDGMNLMQRIVAIVLEWDAGEFRKIADKIRKSKTPVGHGRLAAIEAHVKATREQHQAIRQKSIEEQQSIIVTILESSRPGLAADMTDTQHAQCLEFYSAQLSLRDRARIMHVMCRQSPDFITSLVRDAAEAFEPMIRTVHKHVDLRKYVVYVQKFVDDLIHTSKPKNQGTAKQVRPPSVEDYVLLLRRNRAWFYEYLYEVANGCPDVRDKFRAWLKGVVAEFQQDAKLENDETRGDATAENEDSQPSPTGLASSNGAGSMSDSLQLMFSRLPPDTQQAVLCALEAHDKYTTSLDTLSMAHLQHIIDGLKADKFTANGGGSMTGPGAYRSRWQSLLDDTIITPATPSGPPRRGKDVKHSVTRGKTGANSRREAFDLVEALKQESRILPTPPDVGVVVEALGNPFKKVVAGISCRNT